MSGSATENSILLCVLPRLNNIFKVLINQSICPALSMNVTCIQNSIHTRIIQGSDATGKIENY